MTSGSAVSSGRKYSPPPLQKRSVDIPSDAKNVRIMNRKERIELFNGWEY
jgi:hypothetical protein